MSKERQYAFRREDNGKLTWVPWAVMIMQDRAGFITLSDGAQARRCLSEENYASPQKMERTETGLARTITSDALGFGQHQFGEFEEDRRQHGFSGVEFVRDPQVPEFYQVKCRSRDEFNRYLSHRGYVQQSSLGGVRLSQSDLDRAANLASRSISAK